MNAKELNEAFLEACGQCPQFRGFDDDQEEMVDGRHINVASLHNKGSIAVLSYWRNAQTIGGSVIHNAGYAACLPEEVVSLMERIDSIVNEAIKKALER